MPACRCHQPGSVFACYALLWLACLLLAATGSGLAAPGEGEMNEGRFLPCPDRPNCVSSRASDSSRYVAPLAYEGERDQAWLRLEAVVRAIERAEVVENTGVYLRVTFESRLFGFVDDMEFQIDPPSRLIHMKSASRTGYYDLGVNRRRCEDIRERFQQ